MDFRNNNSSSLVISEEVVSKIAATAAKDIEGVEDVVATPQSFRTMLKTKQVVQPVHVTLKDNQVYLDIYIKVKEGIRLADVAAKVQQAIKEAVQNMTGSVVAKANVHICDIELAAEQKAE